MRQARDIRSGAKVARRTCVVVPANAGCIAQWPVKQRDRDFKQPACEVRWTPAFAGATAGSDVLHRHLAVPHRRARREAFGRIDDGVGVDAVVAVEVADGAGLAELLDAERLDPVAAHAAEPAERRRMAVDHGDDAAVARQRRQQFFDMAEILHATAVAAQVRARRSSRHAAGRPR